MLTQQNEHLHTKIKGRDKEYGILAKSLITHTNKISIAHERHEDLLTKLDTMANEWSNEDIYNKKNNKQKNNKNNKTEGRKEKDVSAIDMLCNSLKEAIGNVQLEAENVASLLETKNNSSGTSTGATGSTSTEKVSKNEETKIDSKKMSPKQGKRRNKKKNKKK